MFSHDTGICDGLELDAIVSWGAGSRKVSTYFWSLERIGFSKPPLKVQQVCIHWPLLLCSRPLLLCLRSLLLCIMSLERIGYCKPPLQVQQVINPMPKPYALCLNPMPKPDA